jgi:nitrate/nitrite transporter NarK
MNRAFLTLTTLVVLLIARSLDLMATFWYNPSLSGEANPIVMVFGGGVRSLLLSVIILLILLTAGLLVFWRGPSLVLRTTPKTFRDFVVVWFRMVALNRQPLTAYLPSGTHWNEGLQALRLFGLALPWAITFGSFAAVYAWLAIYGPLKNHQIIFSTVAIGRFTGTPAISALVGFFSGAFLFFITEFRARRGRGE